MAIRLKCALASLAVAALLAGSAAYGAAQAATKEEPVALVKGKPLAEALARGGYVIYMRHTKTAREQKDTDLSDLSNCAKQRNLSDEGRQQARMIGESFKRLGIAVGQVYNSPYCRAAETARLAFGGGSNHKHLRYLTFLNQTEAQSATSWLSRMLATPPSGGSNTILISHTANLKDGLGLWARNAGDVFVFRPTPGKGYLYIGSIAPDEWQDLVAQRTN